VGTVKTNRYWGSFIVGSTNGYAFYYYGLNPYSNATPGDNSIAYRYGITDTDTWIKDFGSEDGPQTKKQSLMSYWKSP